MDDVDEINVPSMNENVALAPVPGPEEECGIRGDLFRFMLTRRNKALSEEWRIDCLFDEHQFELIFIDPPAEVKELHGDVVWQCHMKDNMRLERPTI